MSQDRPRRGLGRGLGSLIPTAPAPGQANGESPVDETGGTDGGTGVVDAAAAVPAPEMPPVPEGAYFADLPITQVAPNQVQPRQVFEEEAMAELVHSITEIGLLQPVVVRATGPTSYELVVGERRWRAAQEVREHFRDQVLSTSIPRSVRVSEAPSYGQTVMTYDPASPGALSYLEAAREIATRGAPR